MPSIAALTSLFVLPEVFAEWIYMGTPHWGGLKEKLKENFHWNVVSNGLQQRERCISIIEVFIGHSKIY